MRVAMPYLDGQIFPHFGRAEMFRIYFIENDEITRDMVLPTGASGHEAAASLLRSAGVGLVICGGIGGAAIKALDDAGIMVMGGVSGNCDEKIRDFVAGRLQYIPADQAVSHCSHHSHSGSDSCEDAGCPEAAHCEHHRTH